MTTEITNYEVIVQPWYVNLIDDLKTIVVEKEFESRWALVEGYHQLGSRILVEYENFQRLRMDDQSLIATVAISLNKRPRTVYYAVQFARQYPDLNLLPEGKDTNWHKVINKYLTTGKERVTLTKSDVINMVKEIKKLLQTEYQKELQSVNNGEIAINKSNIEFIRYLQDQVNKITGGLDGG